MAPHGEAISVNNYSRAKNHSKSKPPRLSFSSDTLKRTISDISYELSKEANDPNSLPPISEVVDAKCECCSMSEECTPEYIDRVRDKFRGKWICGLCSEAVKEEVEKNGGNKEEALSAHISACVRFNKYGRAYPVLFQAEEMRQMLKRAKSISPRDKGGANKAGKCPIARSSSCIPAITRDMRDLSMA